jgi:hypothetical protein
MALARSGKIDMKDVVDKTQTHNFEADACTVRMSKPTAPIPFVTLHIRGKSVIRTYTYAGGQTYECAETCRVNFGGDYDNNMCSNGNLDAQYSWKDVHNAVEEVKKVMGI